MDPFTPQIASIVPKAFQREIANLKCGCSGSDRIASDRNGKGCVLGYPDCCAPEYSCSITAMAVPPKKYHLLLVEDSDDDIVLFELALKRTGLHYLFEVLRRFSTAEQAIQYLDDPPSMVDPQPPPDIIIVDIKLPDGDGFDVLAAVHRVKPKPAVAIFSSSILAEDKKKAVELGADLFQNKTFESGVFSRFLNWLAHLVDLRRAEEP